jgi:leucyl aminopeptidase (aminopeptidase T)
MMKLPISELRTAEPFRRLFSVQASTVNAIAADMRRRGFAEEHPVVIWKGHASTILDGYTRLAAATVADIVDVPVVAVELADESEALAYAIACQRNRRNLTDAEVARCVAELDKRKTAGRPPAELAQPCANLPDGERAPKSSAATAALLGISPRKVEQIRTVEDHGTPEVRAAVDSGDLSINAAYKATQDARRPVAVETPAHTIETPAPPQDRNWVALLWQVVAGSVETDRTSILAALDRVRKMVEEP